MNCQPIKRRHRPTHNTLGVMCPHRRQSARATCTTLMWGDRRCHGTHLEGWLAWRMVLFKADPNYEQTLNRIGEPCESRLHWEGRQEETSITSAPDGTTLECSSTSVTHTHIHTYIQYIHTYIHDGGNNILLWACLCVDCYTSSNNKLPRQQTCTHSPCFTVILE